MKIRNKYLITAAGFALATTAKLLVKTLRKDYHLYDTNPVWDANRGRHIFSIWHEHLLLPTVQFGSPNMAVLISSHADGQLLAALIHSLRMGTVLGSTTRGGVKALRELCREDNPWQHLAVTPDGPRGPRRVVQQGIIYVASRTGKTIRPVGVSHGRSWKARSWDLFAIPKPFTRGKTIIGEPITVPPGLSAEQLEPYRLQVQEEMDRLTIMAEQWVQTGQFQELAKPAQVFPRLAS